VLKYQVLVRNIHLFRVYSPWNWPKSVEEDQPKVGIVVALGHRRQLLDKNPDNNQDDSGSKQVINSINHSRNSNKPALIYTAKKNWSMARGKQSTQQASENFFSGAALTFDTLSIAAPGSFLDPQSNASMWEAQEEKCWELWISDSYCVSFLSAVKQTKSCPKCHCGMLVLMVVQLCTSSGQWFGRQPELLGQVGFTVGSENPQWININRTCFSFFAAMISRTQKELISSGNL